MSHKKDKIKKLNQPTNVDNATAKEIAQKIKSLQNSKTSNSLTQQPTGSVSRSFTSQSNFIEDKREDNNRTETQASYYKDLYQEEKINSVYSEINNKTSMVESKLSVEIEKIKTLIESKFSSFTKWGIGIIIAVIGIPIGVFSFLLNNQTEKIESNVDLKMEKRITPIENKIVELENRDSLDRKLQKNMPYKRLSPSASSNRSK